ncbi:hypothetical protein GCM10022224_058360 [Nonomuraea antimicrobica]|uniref:Uncharacterized protein n=1 Tax=Nonomuraea antimicrobica TaxID=561173 RepID=A0ABP7CB21_9ACTN
MKVALLDHTGYGRDDYSRQAWITRINENVTAQRNIATFHFVSRPGLDGEAPERAPFMRSETSTGVGTYTLVGGRVQRELRLNLSHSEHQFIEDTTYGIRSMMSAGTFPSQYVVDWVYTERPACPDVWWGGSKLFDGCMSELLKIERLQRSRQWDNPTTDKYGTRTDLEITVYSTFDGASDIKKTSVFSPIYHEALDRLVEELTDLFERAYAAEPGDDYDTRMFDSSSDRARELAKKELPDWNDYVLKSGDARTFRTELREYSAEILQRVRIDLKLK